MYTIFEYGSQFIFIFFFAPAQGPSRSSLEPYGTSRSVSLLPNNLFILVYAYFIYRGSAWGGVVISLVVLRYFEVLLALQGEDYGRAEGG